MLDLAVTYNDGLPLSDRGTINPAVFRMRLEQI